MKAYQKTLEKTTDEHKLDHKLNLISELIDKHEGADPDALPLSRSNVLQTRLTRSTRNLKSTVTRCAERRRMGSFPGPLNLVIG